jgi:hypothetical protein
LHTVGGPLLTLQPTPLATLKDTPRPDAQTLTRSQVWIRVLFDDKLSAEARRSPASKCLNESYLSYGEASDCQRLMEFRGGVMTKDNFIHGQGVVGFLLDADGPPEDQEGAQEEWDGEGRDEEVGGKDEEVGGKGGWGERDRQMLAEREKERGWVVGPDGVLCNGSHVITSFALTGLAAQDLGPALECQRVWQVCILHPTLFLRIHDKSQPLTEKATRYALHVGSLRQEEEGKATWPSGFRALGRWNARSCKVRQRLGIT